MTTTANVQLALRVSERIDRLERSVCEMRRVSRTLRISAEISESSASTKSLRDDLWDKNIKVLNEAIAVDECFRLAATGTLVEEASA